MKIMIAAMLLTLSSLSFAKITASDAFVKALPQGVYQGTTDKNEECLVEVKYLVGFYQSNAMVTASTENVSVSYMANNQNDYSVGRLGRQNVLFFQSEIVDGNEVGSVKIIKANDNKLNVSIGNYEYNGNDRTSAEVSCNI